MVIFNQQSDDLFLMIVNHSTHQRGSMEGKMNKNCFFFFPNDEGGRSMYIVQIVVIVG